MNERSSRSHSVFILRVRGQNSTTMESCDAVLNLVDLAGSERLSNSGSGSDPQRLKEAQSINKSLSSLADVIAALGQNKQGAHIPYRNSTLTWLLKNSLGGNSKTCVINCFFSAQSRFLTDTLRCSLTDSCCSRYRPWQRINRNLSARFASRPKSTPRTSAPLAKRSKSTRDALPLLHLSLSLVPCISCRTFALSQSLVTDFSRTAVRHRTRREVSAVRPYACDRAVRQAARKDETSARRSI